MTFKRGLLNWGIFLIVLAAVPLAVQTGYLDEGAAGGLLRFWPLILVGIGLGLVLRFTPFHALGGVLAAGTLGLLAGALLTGGIGSIGGACVGGSDTGAQPSPSRSGPFGGPGARVELDLSCVQLTVGRQAAGEWRLAAPIEGEGAPRLDASAQRLSLRSAPTAPFFFGNQARRDIDLQLPAEEEFGLSLTLNASRGSLDLAGGPLDALSVTLNASDADIELGAPGSVSADVRMTLNASSSRLSLPAASLDGRLTLNASSLELCAPAEVGLHLRYEDTLSSTNFEAAGLARSGDSWQTAGYDEAATQVELGITANVSSITLQRTGGCP